MRNRYNIIQLRGDSTYKPRWPEDVATIRRVLNEHGYDMSNEDCEMAWDTYSDNMCAGWMSLPEDDFVWKIVSEEIGL